MPGSAVSAGAQVGGVAAGVEHERAVGDGRGEPEHGRDPPRRPGEHLRRRARRSRPAVGNSRSGPSPASRGREPLAERGGEPGWPRCVRRPPTPAGRAPPAAPSRRRRPCPAAGSPVRPRRPARGRDRRRAAASTASGSASRSSSRRSRATAGPRSRGSASRSVATTCRCAGSAEVERDRRRAVRQPQRAAVRAVLDRLDAVERAGGEERRAARRRRTAGGRAAAAPACRRRRARRRGARPPCAAWSAATPYTSRTVSLNWRTLANPAANAMSAIPSGVVSMSSRAVCARCARASASGPAPSSAVSTRFRCRSE